jgi:hypothetical protein
VLHVRSLRASPVMTALVLLAATVIAGAAMQTAPGRASATYVKSPPWADIIVGPMWGGVDTRGYGDTAVSYLKGIGYTAFDDDNNTSPAQALGPAWAQADAVWAAEGHANAGQICVESGGQFGVVRANNQVAVSPNCSALAAADMWAMPSYTLGKMKLMAFIGCYTGNNGKSGSPYNGNLLDEAYYDQGVDSVLGFTGEITSTSPIPGIPESWGLWNDAFWHELALGGTVGSAWYAGIQNVYFWWCQYWGFNTARILGGSVKIKPAGYGS